MHSLSRSLCISLLNTKRVQNAGNNNNNNKRASVSEQECQERLARSLARSLAPSRTDAAGRSKAATAAATAVENVKAQARLCVAMQLSQAIRNLYKNTNTMATLLLLLLLI